MEKNITKMKFEDSLSRLEEIINNLENGNVELDRAVVLYEEGVKLLKHCEAKLEGATLKIEKIINKEGKITVEHTSLTTE